MSVHVSVYFSCGRIIETRTLPAVGVSKADIADRLCDVYGDGELTGDASVTGAHAVANEELRFTLQVTHPDHVEELSTPSKSALSPATPVHRGTSDAELATPDTDASHNLSSPENWSTTYPCFGCLLAPCGRPARPECCAPKTSAGLDSGVPNAKKPGRGLCELWDKDPSLHVSKSLIYVLRDHPFSGHNFSQMYRRFTGLRCHHELKEARVAHWLLLVFDSSEDRDVWCLKSAKTKPLEPHQLMPFPVWEREHGAAWGMCDPKSDTVLFRSCLTKRETSGPSCRRGVMCPVARFSTGNVCFDHRPPRRSTATHHIGIKTSSRHHSHGEALGGTSGCGIDDLPVKRPRSTRTRRSPKPSLRMLEAKEADAGRKTRGNGGGGGASSTAAGLGVSGGPPAFLPPRARRPLAFSVRRPAPAAASLHAPRPAPSTVVRRVVSPRIPRAHAPVTPTPSASLDPFSMIFDVPAAPQPTSRVPSSAATLPRLSALTASTPVSRPDGSLDTLRISGSLSPSLDLDLEGGGAGAGGGATAGAAGTGTASGPDAFLPDWPLGMSGTGGVGASTAGASVAADAGSGASADMLELDMDILFDDDSGMLANAAAGVGSGAPTLAAPTVTIKKMAGVPMKPLLPTLDGLSVQEWDFDSPSTHLPGAFDFEPTASLEGL